jgi:LAGLIDADG endonuclease
MKSFIEYFNCGKIYQYREAIDFKITNFKDLIDKVIPFFTKYPIIGVKALDFADFCKVAEIMKRGEHRTQEGLEEIRKIKEGMNRGREINLKGPRDSLTNEGLHKIKKLKTKMNRER